MDPLISDALVQSPLLLVALWFLRTLHSSLLAALGRIELELRENGQQLVEINLAIGTIRDASSRPRLVAGSRPQEKP